jgi:sec-independent protein translocase protein TatA
LQRTDASAIFGGHERNGVELMGSFSIWHWLIVIVVIMLLFGRGKISELMGDVAKGVKSFKKGLSDDDETPPKTIEEKAATMATETTEEKSKAT